MDGAKAFARRIVVPLDGSEVAERALPEAEALARLTGAPLHVVRVTDIAGLQRVAGYGLAIEGAALVQIMEDERAATRDYLERIGGEIGGRGVAVTTEARHGAAAREIVAAAEEGDVVVMATHGRGGLARWFLGSVAEEVVRRSPVPVLLVRAPPAAAEGPGGGAASA
jgi:nucleotide-binding universal stress UspA family protein